MWWVLRTKSRNEKIAEKRLLKEGFEVYCPQYLTIRQWSDRKKKVWFPLFNGYIFVKSDASLIRRLPFIPGIVGFVYYNGQKAIVRENEIVKIKEFTGELSALATEVIELRVGKRVKVAQGNFEGQVGVVTGKSNNLISLIIESMDMEIIVKLPAASLAEA